MNRIRQLRQKSIVRKTVSSAEQIKQTFHEMLEDINAITAQWNETIYPLIGSLPTGRVKLASQDRTKEIDPVTNGFDGSQIFMDMTATPQVYSGLLHNGERQKTIKEVVLDTHQSLLARMIRVEQLLRDLEGANNDGYDDSELRNWILQLAGDTVSSINIGQTYNAANFANAPEKSVTYSLHQRDMNLRNVLGIEAEPLGILDPIALFAGKTYINDAHDIVDALRQLDDAITAAVAAITLQDAYDGAPDITLAGHLPVEIHAAEAGRGALRLTGRLELLDTDAGAILKPAASLIAAYDNAADTISQLAILRGSGVATGAADLKTITNTDEVMMLLTHTAPIAGDNSIVMRLGYTNTPADEQYTSIEGGTRAATGGYRFRLYSYDTGGSVPGTGLESLGPLFLNTSTGKIRMDATTNIEAYAAEDITLDSGTEFLINSGTTINLIAADDIEIDSTSIVKAEAPFILADITSLYSNPIPGNNMVKPGFWIRETGDTVRPAGFTGYENIMVDANPPTAATNGILVYAQGVYVDGYAPTGAYDTAGVPVAIPNGVKPSINVLYRDNLKKAKIATICLTASGGVSIRDAYNIDTSATSYDEVTGLLTLKLLSDIDTDNYTIIATPQDTGAIHSGVFHVQPLAAVDSKTLEIIIKEFSGGGWIVPTKNILINVEVM